MTTTPPSPRITGSWGLERVKCSAKTPVVNAPYTGQMTVGDFETESEALRQRLAQIQGVKIVGTKEGDNPLAEVCRLTTQQLHDRLPEHLKKEPSHSVKSMNEDTTNMYRSSGLVAASGSNQHYDWRPRPQVFIGQNGFTTNTTAIANTTKLPNGYTITSSTIRDIDGTLVHRVQASNPKDKQISDRFFSVENNKKGWWGILGGYEKGQEITDAATVARLKTATVQNPAQPKTTHPA